MEATIRAVAVRGPGSRSEGAGPGEGSTVPGRVMVRTREGYNVVRVDHIRWIGAEGAYVSLYTREGTHLLRMHMCEFERVLPRRQFARIHRSAIVNLEAVSRMLSLPYGKCAVVLEDGTRLVMSRSFRHGLLRRFLSVGRGTEEGGAIFRRRSGRGPF